MSDRNACVQRTYKQLCQMLEHLESAANVDGCLNEQLKKDMRELGLESEFWSIEMKLAHAIDDFLDFMPGLEMEKDEVA